MLQNVGNVPNALECFKMNVFNFLMLSDAAHGVAKNILDFNLCIK